MRRIALAFAAAQAFALAMPLTPAGAAIETTEAKLEAADAADLAHDEMLEAFGKRSLRNGEYVWKKARSGSDVTRVVISLSNQMAYAYHGDELIGASTISSGKKSKPTPTGIFEVLEKKRHHRSIKYHNAPMPYMQRLDRWGIAMHGGHLPGYPASHGCVRLPHAFAAKLFAGTRLGTPVMIGAKSPLQADSTSELLDET
jgi:lipoprotein-anchoring transpeptidase ErfK/SrfK